MEVLFARAKKCITKELKSKNNTKALVKLKEILVEMLVEFKTQGIKFPIPRDFLTTNNMSLSIGTFTVANTLSTTIKWSNDSMKDETLIEHSGKYTYNLVKRWMDSLENYGFPKYPEYDEEEKNLYLPQLLFGTNSL